MSAGRAFFGVGGTLALFLGAAFQRPEWFYRPGFEAADYDYVRKELSCPDIRLADLDLPCLSLPKTSLADFERQGFLILRQAWIWKMYELENFREKLSWHPSRLQAIPVEAVHRLFREIQCFVAVGRADSCCEVGSGLDCISIWDIQDRFFMTTASECVCVCRMSMQHSKGLEWFCLFGARVLFLRLFAATGVIRPTPVGAFVAESRTHPE